MVGTATLTGRFSVAVVTASPESKVNICEVFIVLYSATDVVSAPAVIFDNELPLITAGQRKFPKTPVIRRIASPCAEPAARFPPVQARKGAGYHKNSSTKAKIQNDGNRNVDRAVFGGGRDYTGGIKCYSLHRALTVGCKSPFSGSCPRQSPRAAGESVLV